MTKLIPTLFYAQPYSIEPSGFYFDSLEKFEAGMEALNEEGCEEVEIQFIDGDDHLCQLANSLVIGQSNIKFWYDELENLDEQDALRFAFLFDRGYLLEDALDLYEDVNLYYGTTEEYAQELTEETTEIPENLIYYIDYEAMARDMVINDKIAEIECDLIVTNAYEF